MIVWIIVGILVVTLFLMNGREGFQQPIRARYIKLTSNTYIQMSQLKVISLGVNIAYQKPVTASSEIVPGMAKKAVDGNSAPRSFPDIYQSAKESSWWQVDLGKDHVINEIVFYNRSDGCTERASKMRMYLLNNAKQTVAERTFTSANEQKFPFLNSPATITTTVNTVSTCKQVNNKVACLNGLKDQKGVSCTWSESKGCDSPAPTVTSVAGAGSTMCSNNKTKALCTATIINAADNLRCSWSDSKNICTAIPFAADTIQVVKDGESYKCNPGTSSKPETAIFRGNGGKLSHYPNPDIYASWGSIAPTTINCTGIALGDPVPMKTKQVFGNNGSVTCNTYCGGTGGSSWNNELASETWTGAKCATSAPNGCDAPNQTNCVCEAVPGGKWK